MHWSTPEKEAAVKAYVKKLRAMVTDFSAGKPTDLVSGAIAKSKMLNWLDCKLTAIDNGDGQWIFDKWGDARFEANLTPAQHAARLRIKAQEALATERRFERLIVSSGIPPAYTGANLTTNDDGQPLQTDDGNRESLRRCRLYIEKWTPGLLGMILYANGNGNGKTYPLCAVGASIIRRGNSFRFISTNRLLASLQASFGVKPDSGERTFEQVFAEYAMVDALLLDEIGGEQIKSGEAGEWSRSVLLRLLEHRIQNKLTTFGTTNLLQSGLMARYEGKINSRLKAIAFWQEVKGKDRRVRTDDPFAED